MRRHAKASSAGSTQRQASGLGRIFRGADATRGSSPDSKGSGAPSQRRLFLCLSLALLLAALFAASAQAAPETIAEYGKGAGQVNYPTGTAVERSTGDLYVTEGNGFRVSKFNSAGSFLLAFGYGVADGVSTDFQTCGPEASPPTATCFDGYRYPVILEARAVAVDQAGGDVYVSGDSRVSKFTSSGQFVFMVGKNVNKTKEAEGGATQAEKDFCSAASGDTCGRAVSGTAPNEFSGNAMPLAVDSAGVVWVGDMNHLASFDSVGATGAEIALPGAGDTESLALDSAGNFFVKSASLAGIRKLEAGTGALLETLDSGGFPRTVTLDESDNVYVGDCNQAGFECPSYVFKIYNPAGEQVFQFGAGQVIGAPQRNALAVGEGADRLYVASSRPAEAESVLQAFPLPEPGPLPEHPQVEDLLPTTVTLAADLNPEGHETTYHFEYGTSESYGESTPTETLAGEEFDSEAVEAQLEELLPSTTYHFRLVATNHCNNSEPAEECTIYGEDSTFTTLPPVSIDREWATDVASTSAVFHAELDPLGVAATWWVEYGTGEGYGSATPTHSLGAGFGDVAVQALVESLEPGTTYHYRFAARDERDGTTYTVHGPDRTILTQFTGLDFSLADNRAWEMVSPSQKFGGRILQFSQGVTQAAADGEGVAYQTATSIEADPDGNRAADTSTVLSRSGAGGSWSFKDVTPPHAEVSELRFGGEYKALSPQLDKALLEQQGNTPLSPEADEETAYLRENADPVTYTPLVTAKEGFANVPLGTKFGGEGYAPGGNSYVSIAATNSSFSHVVLQSFYPLVPGAPNSSLYLWKAGQMLQPLSELPAGEGGAMVRADAGSGTGSIRHAVSEDGSRVFWGKGQASTFNNELHGLYVRDTVNLQSSRLDVPQAGASEAGANNPYFQAASTDGTVVFFTDAQALTADASAGDPGGAATDLYRCDVAPLEGGALGCAGLTDISAPLEGSEERAEVLDLSPHFADDGSRAYFVARGVLDTTPNAVGDTAVAGEPNLYLWEEGQGRRFVATLSERDKTDWGTNGSSNPGEVSKLSASGSPDGRYFAFMSERSLTGYGNFDATSNEAAEEVFRYDALTDRLECISCNPSGANPDAQIVNPTGASPPEVDPQEMWTQRWVAAVLPTNMESIPTDGRVYYQRRGALANGRIFFNAIDSLVRADSNGQWDVYQWEPLGVGDCTASSDGAAIARSGSGCVSLLSSGTGEEEASFLDASETGDDVFFLTPAQLSVTDEDHEVDVYDARVNGVPAVLTPSAECLGEACQPAAIAPNDSTPASAGFKGKGNAKEAARKRCAKGKRRVRRNGKARCVARKHRKHKKHRHHRRAGKSRGAAR